MRSSERLLMSALMTAFLVAGVAVAQPPDRKQEPPPGRVRPAPLSVDDIVERIMAFDKNKDGKVTKDELPERMHHLIALGDTDKDGALDREEIKKLATTLAATPGGFGNAGFRAGPFGVRGEVRTGPGGAPGAGARPGVIEEVVDDLKLSVQKKDQALAVVKAHEENVRKLMDQARAELLQKLKAILSEEELQNFKAALDRPRAGPVAISFGPVDAPRPGDVERRIEQLQKELDDLRRSLRR